MFLSRINHIQAIIGTDAGGRGMKSLIVQGDLFQAAKLLVQKCLKGTTLLILSGFPCCIHHIPPTETDGPPGAVAIGRAGLALGYERVVIVTDDCNKSVFAAACEGTNIDVESFPSQFTPQDETRFNALKESCSILVACERAGPSKDGNCYTMRGIDMTAMGLIAPIHRLVDECNVPFLAIGDGGNELGMGKVYENIKQHIPDGEKIGCVIKADHLIAASVSNWGGYALAGAVAMFKADECNIESWTNRCLPTEKEEIALLNRCVAAGCRDGVSGEMAATVDGMPLERSLECLRDIRRACTTSIQDDS